MLDELSVTRLYVQAEALEDTVEVVLVTLHPIEAR